MSNESQTTEAKTAILLMAHGSHRAEANNDLHRLAGMLRERQAAEVIEASFLEIAEPTIPQGAGRCVEQGAERVLMLPYFLSAGDHVRSDLERHRKELAGQYPHVAFRLCPPLGVHPLMVEIVLDRLQEADSDG